VKLLLHGGAPTDVLKGTKTLLMTVIERKLSSDIVKVLLDGGAPTNVPKRAETMKYLMEAGIPIHDPKNQNPC